MSIRVSSLTIATAGHVDHGKTSLVRRITGPASPSQPMDMSSGMTIDLGFAYRESASVPGPDQVVKTLGFVDVPDHAGFIGNMLCGVGNLEAVLLVVSANDVIMPQTREHLAIVDLLGISRGAVAVTKTDMVSTDRLLEVSARIRELLHGTSLAGLPVMPVSSLTGEGIQALVSHLEALRDESPPVAGTDHYTRFIIDRSFTQKGIGTIVTGSLRNGMLSLGDRLMHSLDNRPARIKGMRHHQFELEQALPGQRLALQIDLPHHGFSRGQWLADPHALAPEQTLIARLRTLPDFVPSARSLFHLFAGASHTLTTVKRLGGNDSPWFQLRTRDPVLSWLGDQLVLLAPAGRVAVAGGHAIEHGMSEAGKGSEARLNYFQALDQDALGALHALLRNQRTGVDLGRFARLRGLKPAAAEALLERLAADTPLERGPPVNPTVNGNLPWLIHRDFYTPMRDGIRSAVGQHHQRHPDQPGIAQRALFTQLGADQKRTLPRMLEILIKRGDLTGSGGFLALPDHRPQLSPRVEAFMVKVKPLLAGSGFVPPRTREIAEQLHLPLDHVERCLRECTRAALLVKVADNRHYLPQTLQELAQFTRNMVSNLESDGEFSVIQFRDASGIGRNLCIEILEYFDSVGLTRRDGNRRYLRNFSSGLAGSGGDLE